MVAARNRNYPILIPCLESIPEPVAMLKSIPITEPTSEQVQKLTPEAISESISTWESQFAPINGIRIDCRNGISSEMRIS